MIAAISDHVEEAVMLNVMLDSSAFDCVALTPGLVERINALQDGGVLRILSTTVQEDELARTPNGEAEKKAAVARIKRTLVPTAGGRFDISRYDNATYGDGGESGMSVKQIETDHGGRLEDSLVATAASQHAHVLVITDKRFRSATKRSTIRCKVWTFTEFAAWLDAPE